MNNKNIFQRGLLILCLFFGLQGCASVPPEVVELSALTGRDLVRVHASYQTLIHEFYEQLRGRRIDYLENTWTPAFIENWVEDGRLRDVARGVVVWDDNALDADGEPGDFVPSSSVDNREARLLDSILGWADAAVNEIEEKRKELLAPLNKEEKTLRKEVDLAFANLIRANAATTAYLNSLVKVKAAQDQILEAFELEETRDKINAALLQASETANEGLEKIRKADQKLGEL